jgi:hypothetical protein
MTPKPTKKTAPSTQVQSRIASQDRRRDARDEQTVHHEETRGIPSDDPPSSDVYGTVTVGRTVRMALAFNSMEVHISVALPVKNLRLAVVPDVTEQATAVLDEEMSRLLPEIGKTLVQIGEFRDEQEAEYRLKKKGVVR